MATSEGYVSVELMIIWSLLSTLVVLTYFIQRFRFHLVPPSGVAMLLGIMAGIIFKLAGYAKSLRFSPAAFFYGLLPPIVFAAGFSLKKKNFFKYFAAINVFAIFGTVISTCVFAFATWLLYLVGLVSKAHLGDKPLTDSLLYGAAISSIDPVATLSVFNDLTVPPLLYNLVFGESVLNDAVAIVLFRTIEEFRSSSLTLSSVGMMSWRFLVNFAGSLAIGIVVALMCASILKRFQLSGSTGDAPVSPSFDPTMYEIGLVVMSSYLAYLVAEVTKFSGIVALFFTGICHAHYSYYNSHHDTQIALTKSFNFVAFLCETFVFAYLGIQVATMKHAWDTGLVLSGIPLCLMSRALNIFPLAALINLGRKYPLPLNLQAMQWAVGLRGAVAYGLVVNIGNPAIETATLVIVVISTLLFGSATGPLLRWFKLEGKDDTELLLASDHPLAEYWVMGQPLRRAPVSPAIVAHIRQTEIERPSWMHLKWKQFDRQFMKPVFGGRMPDSRMSPDGLELSDVEEDTGSYMEPTAAADAVISMEPVMNGVEPPRSQRPMSPLMSPPANGPPHDELLVGLEPVEDGPSADGEMRVPYKQSEKAREHHDLL